MVICAAGAACASASWTDADLPNATVGIEIVDTNNADLQPLIAPGARKMVVPVNDWSDAAEGAKQQASAARYRKEPVSTSASVRQSSEMPMRNATMLGDDTRETRRRPDSYAISCDRYPRGRDESASGRALLVGGE